MKSKRGRWQRLDGRIVNLKVGQSIAVPLYDAPARAWFHWRERHWRRWMPSFTLKTSLRAGMDSITVTRIS